MKPSRSALGSALAFLFAVRVSAQAASGSVTSTILPTPSVAPGFTVQRVARALETPRGIVFDNSGRLLTVQRGTGVVGLDLSTSDNGTVTSSGSNTIIDDDTLNHGIALSDDSRTLYASSTEHVFSWAYDPSTGANTSEPTILVGNMTTSDHTTRTLLLSQKAPGMLIVTRGSTSNVDPLAMDITTGHSQIKAFDLRNMTGPYDFNTDGLLLGWGLRNEVGIAEEPMSGGLYGVENSVDQMTRMGKDIHATNPGEELNYLGTMVDNTSPNQGSNFGYPECYSAWDTSVIPDNNGLEVGMQFAIGKQDAMLNDSVCQGDRTAPRLVFESHMAPLDIKFDTNGTTAWITFHGSWNRSPNEPSGYKLSAIPFRHGEPVAPSTSNTGYTDIVSNMDNSQCPDQCFRPVGMAWDSQGRLFFSSDATGEIYMLMADNVANNGSVDGATIPSPSPTTDGSGASMTASAAAGGNTAASIAYAPLLYVGAAAVGIAGLLM